jgi:neurotransmitter:Na+ symporter, NSS family
LLVTEITVGRATQRNPIGAFRALAPNTPWWLVGALGVLTAFVILSYYSVVAGWSLAYTAQSLAGLYAPGVDYADRFVGHITQPVQPILWHALFMIFTIGIVAAGVIKGIQRSVEILMPALFILLVLLIVRALTLPGAGQGVAFILQPDFAEVSGRTFLYAISQAFFTLSLGMGAMLTYGSYLSNRENVPANGGFVAGIDTGVAILGGLAIFPAVFALGFDPASGPGLAFITLPAVFAEMPAGAIFGFLFFLLLSIAALTSAISLLEVVVAYLVDEARWARMRAAVLTGIIMFFVGIPASLGYSTLADVTFLGLDLLDTYDWLANSFLLPLGGLLTAIFAGYVWGARNFTEKLNEGAGRFRLGGWMIPLLRYLVPIAIVIVMIWGLVETFAG